MGLRNTFSTVLTDIPRNNTVYVESLNVFDSVRVGNIVSVPNLVKYITTQPLNMGLLQFIPDTPGGVAEFTSSNIEANTWTTELENNDPLFSGDFGVLIHSMNISSATGTSKLFDINATTVDRALVFQERGLISNFGSIGSITGASSGMVLMAYFGCGEGIVITNPGDENGLDWDFVRFENQLGNHLTVVGQADFMFYDKIRATPANGDQVFDFSQTDNIVTAFSSLGIDTSLGGKTGLEQEVSSDTVLGSIFPFINVDTTNNPVEITLPEVDGFGITNGTIRSIRDEGGNAGTNNIEVIPNPNGFSTRTDGRPSFTMNTDDQVIIVELTDSQWLLLGNTGLPPLGSFALKQNVSVTTIANPNEFTDIAGAATAPSQNNLFIFTSSPNVLESISANTYDAFIQVNGSLKRSVGASTRNYALALFEDAGSGFIQIAGGESNSGVTLQPRGVSFGVPATIVEGNKYKVMVENRTTADDVIVDYDIEIKPERRV